MADPDLCGQQAPAFGVTVDVLDGINERQDHEGFLKLGGLPGVASALHVSLSSGMSPAASDGRDVESRRAAFGANRYKAIPPKNFFRLWFNNLKDPTLILLMAAALALTILGVAGLQHGASAWAEGGAIWVTVLVVSLVGAFNDWGKDRQFQKLNALQEVMEVKVVRGGQQVTVPNTDVVVGDLLLLEEGDKVVADGYVVEAHGCLIDEASLTGECDPVRKGGEHDPWLRSGTQVSEGSASVLVLAVGERSEWGRTMALVVCEAGMTPLQEKLGLLATAFRKLGFVVAVICCIVQLVRWRIQEGGFSADKAGDGPLHFFICVVTVLVAAVRNGLRLAVTIWLVWLTKKLMNGSSFVRFMAASEAVAGATTISSDRAGTLTKDRVTVVKGYFCGQMYEEVPSLAHLPAEAGEEIALNSALNSKAFLVEGDSGTVDFVGNRTECALLMMVRAWGRDYKAMRDLHHSKIVEIYNFPSELKMASVLVQHAAGRLRLYSKGAAEMMLSRCVALVDHMGASVPLSEEKREELGRVVTEMASSGLRALCLAYADCDEKVPASPADFFEAPHRDNMTALCIVGIKDPMRKEVPDAVTTCQRAGIMARSSPKAKLIPVQPLKTDGDAVAVTDDSADAALEEGDVGLAMAGQATLPVWKELGWLATAIGFVVLLIRWCMVEGGPSAGKMVALNAPTTIQLTVCIVWTAVALSRKKQEHRRVQGDVPPGAAARLRRGGRSELGGWVRLVADFSTDVDLQEMELKCEGGFQDLQQQHLCEQDTDAPPPSTPAAGRSAPFQEQGQQGKNRPDPPSPGAKPSVTDLLGGEYPAREPPAPGLTTLARLKALEPGAAVPDAA